MSIMLRVNPHQRRASQSQFSRVLPELIELVVLKV
jgi:hypothetical protein